MLLNANAVTNRRKRLADCNPAFTRRAKVSPITATGMFAGTESSYVPSTRCTFVFDGPHACRLGTLMHVDPRGESPRPRRPCQCAPVISVRRAGHDRSRPQVASFDQTVQRVRHNILKAGRPSRADSSLIETSPMPNSAANPGSRRRGVGAYSSRALKYADTRARSSCEKSPSDLSAQCPAGFST
jgi:hypothetical protein